MKPVLTLTLNPSIDSACEAEKVVPTHKVRTSNERYDPGGGGINVARVIDELGGRATALYLCGGTTGSVLTRLLQQRGVDSRCVEIAGDTRIAHMVYERSTGREFRFVPEGPSIREAEYEACLDELRRADFEWIVASGSLPRGVPDDFYARLAALARERGARFVLDTSGDALRAALDAGGVHLVKPSLNEFEQLVGRTLREPRAQEDAAMEFVRSGKVDCIAVTMGHEGALLASRSGVFRLPAMKIEVRSAVGAGDSFLAAMTWGLASGRDIEDAFRLGVAAGTAAVTTPGTELCRREDVERFFAML